MHPQRRAIGATEYMGACVYDEGKRCAETLFSTITVSIAAIKCRSSTPTVRHDPTMAASSRILSRRWERAITLSARQ